MLCQKFSSNIHLYIYSCVVVPTPSHYKQHLFNLQNMNCKARMTLQQATQANLFQLPDRIVFFPISMTMLEPFSAATAI